jgi:Na+-translocating ferredoxin:NAD+ oxidoreductase RnfD subunit
MPTNKRLLGASIFGSLNCFLFGLLPLTVFISAYLRTTSQDLAKIIQILKEQGLAFEVSLAQFKVACILYTVLALAFLLSGIGLLLVKEWGRQLTVYFSFLVVVLIFLSALMMPVLVKQAIVQIIYPGALIVYFTNKNVEGYFRNRLQ